MAVDLATGNIKRDPVPTRGADVTLLVENVGGFSVPKAVRLDGHEWLVPANIKVTFDTNPDEPMTLTMSFFIDHLEVVEDEGATSKGPSQQDQ